MSPHTAELPREGAGLSSVRQCVTHEPSFTHRRRVGDGAGQIVSEGVLQHREEAATEVWAHIHMYMYMYIYFYIVHVYTCTCTMYVYITFHANSYIHVHCIYIVYTCIHCMSVQSVHRSNAPLMQEL